MTKYLKPYKIKIYGYGAASFRRAYERGDIPNHQIIKINQDLYIAHNGKLINVGFEAAMDEQFGSSDKKKRNLPKARSIESVVRTSSWSFQLKR